MSKEAKEGGTSEEIVGRAFVKECGLNTEDTIEIVYVFFFQQIFP